MPHFPKKTTFNVIYYFHHSLLLCIFPNFLECCLGGDKSGQSWLLLLGGDMSEESWRLLLGGDMSGESCLLLSNNSSGESWQLLLDAMGSVCSDPLLLASSVFSSSSAIRRGHLVVVVANNVVLNRPKCSLLLCQLPPITFHLLLVLKASNRLTCSGRSSITSAIWAESKRWSVKPRSRSITKLIWHSSRLMPHHWLYVHLLCRNVLVLRFIFLNHHSFHHKLLVFKVYMVKL